VLLTALHFGSDPVIREIDGFRGCGFISVTIPASVELIISNGFAECQLLQAASVETAAHLTYIDGFADSCLCHLVLPSSVSMIGSSGFNACRYLQSLPIPEDSLCHRVAGFRRARLQRIVVDDLKPSNIH
jgi:hypothetical protein